MGALEVVSEGITSRPSEVLQICVGNNGPDCKWIARKIGYFCNACAIAVSANGNAGVFRAARLGGLPDVQFDAQSCGGEHVHQSVDGEEVDASAHEVGDPGLGDSEDLCGLALGEAFAGDVALEREHERGAKLHVFGEEGKCYYLDGVPYARCRNDWPFLRWS